MTIAVNPAAAGAAMADGGATVALGAKPAAVGDAPATPAPTVVLGITADPVAVPPAVPAPAPGTAVLPAAATEGPAIPAPVVALVVGPAPVSMGMSTPQPSAAVGGPVPIPITVVTPLVTLTILPAATGLGMSVPDPSVASDMMDPVVIGFATPAPLLTLELTPDPVSTPPVIPAPVVAGVPAGVTVVVVEGGAGAWAPPPAPRVPLLQRLFRRRRNVVIECIAGADAGSCPITIRRDMRFRLVAGARLGIVMRFRPMTLARPRQAGVMVLTVSLPSTPRDFTAGLAVGAPLRASERPRALAVAGARLATSPAATADDYEAEELALLGLPSDHEAVILSR